MCPNYWTRHSTTCLAGFAAAISKGSYCLVSGPWVLVDELRNLHSYLIFTRILPSKND